MNTISITYNLKWELDFAEEYKFDKAGRCFNTKRQREIKRTVNCRSVGYCIKGKFYTLSFLRNRLVKIKNIKLPF